MSGRVTGPRHPWGLKKGCCAAAVIAPAPDGRSTWRFNHGHLRSISSRNLAAHVRQWTAAVAFAPPQQHIWTVGFGYAPPMSVSGQQPSHSHRRGSTFGRSVLVLKTVACASLY
eukprot:scaffold92573_cov106-Cyclotella_meneghiniana.AAC.1